MSVKLNILDYVINLSDIIGSGTFGVVYTAKHATDDDTVIAAKKCKLQNKTQIKLAQREIDLFKRLHEHPHTVTLHSFTCSDVSATGTSMWLFMEFCDAGDLEKYVCAKNPPLDFLKEIMFQCASAIHYMHSSPEPMVHRDLKPQNVVMKTYGSAVVAKITDFGLAKTVQLNEQAHSVVFNTKCGTPVYMAPEFYQTATKEYGKPVDVFALGLLYMALILHKPGNDGLSPQTGKIVSRLGELLALYKASNITMPDITADLPADTKDHALLKEMIALMTAYAPRDRIKMDEVERKLQQIGGTSPLLSPAAKEGHAPLQNTIPGAAGQNPQTVTQLKVSRVPVEHSCDDQEAAKSDGKGVHKAKATDEHAEGQGVGKVEPKAVARDPDATDLLKRMEIGDARMAANPRPVIHDTKQKDDVSDSAYAQMRKRAEEKEKMLKECEEDSGKGSDSVERDTTDHEQSKEADVKTERKHTDFDKVKRKGDEKVESENDSGIAAKKPDSAMAEYEAKGKEETKDNTVKSDDIAGCVIEKASEETVKSKDFVDEKIHHDDMVAGKSDHGIPDDNGFDMVKRAMDEGRRGKTSFGGLGDHRGLGLSDFGDMHRPHGYNHRLSVGQKVMLDTDERRIERLQPGYGIWKESMRVYLGQSCVVTGVRNNVKVMFHDGRELLFNPKLLLPGESVYYKPHKVDTPEIILVRNRFKKSDVVRIKTDDAEVFKCMQEMTSIGWNPEMTDVMDSNAIVIHVKRATDVLVEFINGVQWQIHPDLLKHVYISGQTVEPGDMVIVKDDRDLFRSFSSFLSRYDGIQMNFLGEPGIVKQVLSDREVIVDMGDHSFHWPPDLLKIWAKRQDVLRAHRK